MRGAALASCALALAACSPQSVADSVARQTARTVVLPVVEQYMPGPAAQGVTTGIIDNATAQELSALSRDVGVRAGTTTVQNVVTIATRPDTIRCLQTSGLPLLPAV